MGDRKYRVVSLGCPKNLVDSEVLAAGLENAGFSLSDDPDVIVVNTCAFITDATQESIETILEEAKRKEEARGRKLIVAGCLVERYREKLESLFPEVDLFLPTARYGEIGELATGASASSPSLAARPVRSARRMLTRPPSTYLKIQEGCNNHCTYCTIPRIRGPLQSRAPEEIASELASLYDQGMREFTIVGQDITSFGRGRGSRLTALLRTLLAHRGEYHLRLLYLHPRGIDAELLDLVASEPRIIPYLDIPIQHSEDRVLEAMNRAYTKRDLEGLLTKVREKLPDVVLRTTVMVGFPGETEDELEGLCQFLRKWEFDNLGAFVYSREEGTVADRMKGQIAKGVKKKRYRRVMEIQKEISARRMKRFTGRTMKVVVEEKNGTGTVGRLLVQAPDVDGVAFLRGPCEVGEIRDGLVVSTRDYDVTVDLL